SVTAFCQLTILRGSYDAFRSSVCSNLNEFCPTPVGVSIAGRYCERADSRGRAPRGVVGSLCDHRLLTPSVPDAGRNTDLAPRTTAPRTSGCVEPRTGRSVVSRACHEPRGRLRPGGH